MDFMSIPVRIDVVFRRLPPAGERCSGKIRLEPYGVRVLREE